MTIDTVELPDGVSGETAYFIAFDDYSEADKVRQLLELLLEVHMP